MWRQWTCGECALVFYVRVLGEGLRVIMGTVCG